MPSTLSKLYDAAASGSVERTVALLSGGSVDIDGGYGDAGWSPLMVASTMGYLRVVRVLLRLGARVSVTDNAGATALHLSIVNKHLAVSKALVKAGADVGARACFLSGSETIRGSTPLHLAAIVGFHEGMVVLINAGANVDSRLHTDETLLYISARYGRVEDVRLLLRAKANPLLHVEKSSPLNVAAYVGNLDVVQELVQRCGINGCAYDGGTKALEAAASQKHAHVVAFLCDSGVVDESGRGLCAAVQSRDEACVKLLMRRQQGYFNPSTRAYVNIEHINPEYKTPRNPLVCTFMLGRFLSPRIARLLVDASVDTTTAVRFEDNEGGLRSATPIEIGAMALDKLIENPDLVDGVKGVVRLLHQVEAVHATSWLWPTDIGRAKEGEAKTKSTSIIRMLPVLKRRATKPRVLSAALSRYNGKEDGPFLG